MTADISVLRHYLEPIAPLLAPADVTELVINRPGEVGIEDRQGWRWLDVPALTPAWLTTLATAAAAHTRQDILPASPICSTVLPGGERCQIVIPPVAPADTPSFTIRKPSQVTLGIDDLADGGLFSLTRVGGKGISEADHRLLALRDAGDWPAFFRLAVQSRKNILVSGATGSGKTTFAKALVQLIPDGERLVTIEDARELVVPHRNTVHLVYANDGQGLAKVGPKQLLESALRMRPDRVLLQELRDGTAFFYLRNVNSGHPGSITTVHAGSAAGAIEQLTLLVKESEGGRDLARDDIRGLLRMLVDVIVQTRKDAGRFGVEEVHFAPQGDGIDAHA
ncbi:P-type DNA transfer ATPase VirB11 (plasmid) [Tardibacter chloracetimidivorans]|uniref:Type IV secretion system protein n=2 Tax=Sphingomonadaceae TaxID=41297 RepID=A0A1L4A0J2_9SPHN|nr:MULTISPECIES: P-type DNA transfer ATPase VirB11 [Sphingomonadaceae]API61339.1 P-type DNA transfer ATPase VirB11 [Tardibacter chloracetimidivorans]MBB4151216.1 type IV secretion system protein VirB11 [Sphingobium scionense]